MDLTEPATFFVGLIVGFIIAAIIAAAAENPLKPEAIERGYALHCPDTGKFAWKGECGE